MSYDSISIQTQLNVLQNSTLLAWQYLAKLTGVQTCSPRPSNKACPDCHVWQVCKKDCPCSCFVNFKSRLLKEEWLKARCNSVELIYQISWIIEIIRNKTHSHSAKNIFHLQVPLDLSSYCPQWESITTYSGPNCAHVALQMVVVSESNIC